MTLMDRLLGTEEPKLPVHQFMAALAEYRRGAITGSQVASAFGLTGAEVTQLQEFLDNLDASTVNRALIHDVLMLGAVELYTKAFVKTRLGIT